MAFLQSPHESTSRLIDVPELCKLLGDISDRHARRMIDAGTIPGVVRLGRLIRIRRDELEKWIADGCPKQVTTDH